MYIKLKSLLFCHKKRIVKELNKDINIYSLATVLHQEISFFKSVIMFERNCDIFQDFSI